MLWKWIADVIRKNIIDPSSVLILDILLKTKAEADVEINSMMISSVSDLGKAWSCCVCNFSHKKKDNVFRHVDQLHYGYSFSCEICGTISPTLYALYYHNKIHHKQ